jgi:hypothetical protein
MYSNEGRGSGGEENAFVNNDSIGMAEEVDL